jgi:hypothetical protein
MNAQIRDIYIDVLVNKWEIALLKRVGEKYHVVTYSPHPPVMKLLAKGWALEVLLPQTSYHDYILQSEK